MEAGCWKLENEYELTEFPGAKVLIQVFSGETESKKQAIVKGNTEIEVIFLVMSELVKQINHLHHIAQNIQGRLFFFWKMNINIVLCYLFYVFWFFWNFLRDGSSQGVKFCQKKRRRI